MQLEELDSRSSIKVAALPLGEDEQPSVKESLRRWPRLTLYALSLTSGIMLWGFDMSLVGNLASMPEFQKVFGLQVDDGWIIASNWLSIWNIASNLGMMLGSVIAGWLGDKLGRREMVAIGTTISAVAAALLFVCDTMPTRDARCGFFFFAKTIQGLSNGVLTTSIQTWMSETVPASLRGPVLALFPIFQLVGQIIGAVVIQVLMDVPGRRGYRTGIATMWPVGAVPFVAAFFMPESPAWLLRRSLTDHAFRAHQRLEKSKRNPNTEHSFEKLQATIRHEEQVAAETRVSYKQCFTGTDRRRTLLVIGVMMLPELFGQHLVGSASYFLQQVGLNASTANLFFIIGIALSMVSLVVSWWTLTRFGRRVLTLSTLSAVTILWLAVGIVGCLREGMFTRWFVPVSFMVIVIVAGVGVWPASYVIASETSSLRLRARTQGIGWLVNGLTSGIIGATGPYLYNADAADAGAKTGFLFVGLAGISVVVAYFHVPEMKARSPAEIDQMFEAGLKAPEFRAWRAL